MTDASIIEELDLLTTQDHSKLTHIVDCPDEEDSAQGWVDKAKAQGLELTALCGHKWIAQSDPIKHPICQPCLDIAQIRLAE